MKRDHVALSIDQDTGDLKLVGNSLVLATGAEAVGQHARQRIGTFYGEWFLDKTIGLQWLTEIFAQGYKPDLAAAVVKGTLASTDGVTEVIGLAVNYDDVSRGLIVTDAEVATVYGESVTV